MEFRIADTFTDSLARLTGEEQKAVKTTAFDLQMNSPNPGLSFHKLNKARDKNFWSVRVDRGLRMIVHRSNASLLLCYVGHHDKAYDWAERRKLETHPKTGAAQLVVIRETAKEAVLQQIVQPERTSDSGRAPKSRLLFSCPGGRSVERRISHYRLEMVLATGYRCARRAACVSGAERRKLSMIISREG